MAILSGLSLKRMNKGQGKTCVFSAGIYVLSTFSIRLPPPSDSASPLKVPPKPKLYIRLLQNPPKTTSVLAQTTPSGLSLLPLPRPPFPSQLPPSVLPAFLSVSSFSLDLLFSSASSSFLYLPPLSASTFSWLLQPPPSVATSFVSTSSLSLSSTPQPSLRAPRPKPPSPGFGPAQAPPPPRGQCSPS